MSFENRSLFCRVKKFFKSNHTRHRVSHVYLECKTKRIIAIAYLGKKLVFHTEICDYFQYLIFKYSFFHRVKELFKSNKSRYGVSHGYLECKTKKTWSSLPRKKLVFHAEICEFQE